MVERNELHPKHSRPFYIPRVVFAELTQRLEILERRFAGYFPDEYRKAAHGDWRENSPKDALDQEWGLTKAALKSVEDKIGRAVIVDDLEIDTSSVCPGCQVTVENDQGGVSDFIMLSIVDSKKGYVSVDSPVGRALLGRKQGDTVLIRTPRGRMHSTIKEIKKPVFPEHEQESQSRVEEISTVQQPSVLPMSRQIFPGNQISSGVTVGTPTMETPQQSSFSTPSQPEKPGKRLSDSVTSKQGITFHDLLDRLRRQKIQFTQEKKMVPLKEGGRETQEIVEFTMGVTRTRIVLSTRPKVTATSYHYTRRRGTVADIHFERSQTEVETVLKAYRFANNRWEEIDFKT